MDANTKLKVEEYVPRIRKHLLLGTEPKESRETIVIRRGLEICKAIVERPQTAYELAKALNLSPQTIFQYMGGMENGGLPVKRSPGLVNARTGRPETIFSI